MIVTVIVVRTSVVRYEERVRSVSVLDRRGRTRTAHGNRNGNGNGATARPTPSVTCTHTRPSRTAVTVQAQRRASKRVDDLVLILVLNPEF